MVKITQEYLKENFKYNEITGEFIRTKCRMRPSKIGVSAYTKHNSGYYCVSIGDNRYLAHRLIWLYVYGVLPDFIDHINRDKLDNRLTNLRSVSRRINSENRACNGVDLSRRITKPFRSRITVKGTSKLLGHFATYEAAKDCYLKYKRELHEGYVELG